ncbi:ABC transporter permease subunit [Gordonia sp. SID5947]|uniref:ABC transporter permease n=1 Tax=Gordonia sp. SID5947 TaxID=2690315 RepID=UPI00136EAE44|nr:ABC transporter permease [Gordonia sp. SID5947]MYR06658.1 ABC transporter permease subunit [Gordonia sp. SID5947]
MREAIYAERVKFAYSPVGRAATALLGCGIAMLSCAMPLAARSGDPQMLDKLGEAGERSWDGLLSGAAQVTGAGGLLGFGVVLGWMFGREFVDGTITGLFALPVSRSVIASAKLIVYLVWAVVASSLIVATLLLGGLALGLGAPSAETVTGLGRQFALGVLSAIGAIPVAWLATLGRSVLVGVVGSIGLVIAAQVATIGGAGGWFTIAAPALWAISDGREVSVVQLALVVPIALAAVVATMLTWRRLQLTR